MPDIGALDRLKSQLLTSGLSQTNHPLYQVINQLIDYLRQTIKLTQTQIDAIISEMDSPTDPTGAGKLIEIGKPYLEYLVEREIIYQGPKGDTGTTGPAGAAGTGAAMPLGFDDWPDYDSTPAILGNIDPSAGNFINVAYSAANFTASSGNWTVDSGDVVTHQYALIGNVMVLNFYVFQTDVSAAAAHLRLTIPAGKTASAEVRGVGQANDAGGATVAGLMRTQAGNTYVELYKTLAGGNWTITAADNTSYAGQLIFGVR